MIKSFYRKEVMFMNTVGKKIRQRREELGITQLELAKMMGYTSRSTISKIESGINDITQTTIVKFAQILDTTPAFIMGWLDEDIQELADAQNDAFVAIADEEVKNLIEEVGIANIMNMKEVLKLNLDKKAIENIYKYAKYLKQNGSD